jgi:hypothetical protein
MLQWLLIWNFGCCGALIWIFFELLQMYKLEGCVSFLQIEIKTSKSKVAATSKSTCQEHKIHVTDIAVHFSFGVA